MRPQSPPTLAQADARTTVFVSPNPDDDTTLHPGDDTGFARSAETVPLDVRVVSLGEASAEDLEKRR